MMILLGPQQGNAISGGGDGRVEIGKDEALFWIWWCVEGGKKEGEELEEGLLFSLVEVRLSFYFSVYVGTLFVSNILVSPY